MTAPDPIRTAQVDVESILKRVDTAIETVTKRGRALMSIPVQKDDVDIVLADCADAIRALAARCAPEPQAVDVDHSRCDGDYAQRCVYHRGCSDQLAVDEAYWKRDGWKREAKRNGWTPPPPAPADAVLQAHAYGIHDGLAAAAAARAAAALADTRSGAINKIGLELVALGIACTQCGSQLIGDCPSCHGRTQSAPSAVDVKDD